MEKYFVVFHNKRLFSTTLGTEVINIYPQESEMKVISELYNALNSVWRGGNVILNYKLLKEE